ncbi:MAG: EAL domain-containing protein [Marinospirillum sp.]|uniref:EAL domain-containing protein n=1 Tax=Marinospirillum sp. TaxID=2183934 RepID=UPI0019DE9BD0|nr:EAL domain-containing protein [Marinospirillum sp.]MBE0508710.1 EAL domain-containing protein [Marinospirillum sp.]
MIVFFALLFLLPARMTLATPIEESTSVYRLAILAFRDKESTLERWQPLADYLSASIQNADFELFVYHNAEMEAIVAQGGTDFILTQPAQYVLLTYRHQLSSPLASLLNKEGGHITNQFGGVVFTRSDRNDIVSLKDVRGKKIAAASLTGLGAYQMQAFELLQLGIRLPRNAEVIITGQPQRNAVDAVLSGQADVGFVRTGVLEALVEHGLVDISKIKLLNAQRLPKFPFMTSTRLYPEWSFAAMPNVDNELTRQVVAALLAMPREGEQATAMNIAGFTIPGDYRTVDLLMRELHLEPFDDFAITAKDVLVLWANEIIIVLIVCFFAAIFFIYILLKHQRRAKQERQDLREALNEVRLLKNIVEQSPESILITNNQGSIVYTNPMFETNTGYSMAEVVGKNPRIFQSGETPQATFQALWKTLLAGRVWRGELCNKKKNGQIYPLQAIISPVKNTQGEVLNYLAIQHDISEEKDREKRIDELLYRDSVTGLANRNKLIESMDQSFQLYESTDIKGALLLINISRFKFINQLHGVDVGDAVLSLVAQRLEQAFAEKAVVARLAADQFAIFCENKALFTQVDDWLTMLGQRALSSFMQPLQVKGEAFKLEIYIGIAPLSSHSHSATSSEAINQALNQANWALKDARQGSSHGIKVFNQQMLVRSLENHRLQHELEQAIAKDELRLFVQPQVNQQQELVGLECLVRWQHPVQGLLLPGKFIGLAEESDLIVQLGEWVLNRACMILAEVQQSKPMIRVAVNVSPRHFSQANFVANCIKHLDAAQANPSGLIIEITESLFMDNFNEVVEKMHSLKTLGVRFSIDDFGTGYSSLSYLQHLPVDEVKIDRSFILTMQSLGAQRSLVPTIYAMAQQMQLQVIAEGIETQEQREQLSQFERLDMQGFLFSKPVDHQDWLGKKLAI